MSSLPSLVAFGSVAPWPTREQMQQLQGEIQRKAALLAPLTAAVQDLSAVWPRLVAEEAGLGAVAGPDAAERLARWMGGSADALGADESRSMVALPVTILTHMVQYLNVLEQAGAGPEHGHGHTHPSLLASVAAGGGVQGFCAGLLSALAVSSAASEAEIAVLAGTAVTLAFCVGAYVDGDPTATEDGRPRVPYTSLAARWHDPTTADDVQRILGQHPHTYVSAVRDVRDVTITAPADAVGPLQADLAQQSVASRATGLHGRYHAGVHRDGPAKIVRACRGRLHPDYGKQTLVRSNADARLLSPDQAVPAVLASILAQQAHWHQAMAAAAQPLHAPPSGGRGGWILAIGTDAVPPSVARHVPVAKIHAAVRPAAIRDVLSSAAVPGPTAAAAATTIPATLVDYADYDEAAVYPEHAVAVIGMACKFPGADSVDEFWDMLTTGRSMRSQVPAERFDAAGHVPRSAPAGRSSSSGGARLPFWGHFVRDVAAFDHKFFGKSAREAASMDPQQRILLQVAYQALASSGYFADPAPERDVGCYVGACATDYDGNVGVHAATAYATTGTLRAFLSGRLSHCFGWTGPSLVLDTACSSSAVAIHTACVALAAGACAQAVAGGVTLITTPYLYENLAAAHFLSASGATRPFDAAADGYGRGEGAGLVVLKRLARARADHDAIAGVLTGSAVSQSANCVAITVPHAPSQSALYRRVAAQAGVDPHAVAFVEAHGTGTPVGDPIEMESIRRVFAGPPRQGGPPLVVSSVKGHIGHLEGASGVAGLIKALLQMEHRTACAQASFTRLHPRIPPLGPDHLCIPTANQPLTAPVLVACINNYGAAGSNAALMLAERPPRRRGGAAVDDDDDDDAPAPLARLPIQIAAASPASLARYVELVADFAETSSSSSSLTTTNLAFSLAREQNQALPQMLTMVTTRTTDVQALGRALRDTLGRTAGDAGVASVRPHEPPVVLCFGGQVGQHVGLSRRLGQGCALFRAHLDDCDAALRALGYRDGLYPAVWAAATTTTTTTATTTPPRIESVVTLHAGLFAVQYAAARAWMDAGLRVDGLVGHSLGQFAALCVAGVLSLPDALRLVAGRAALMETHWGPEPGAMVAVEADAPTLEAILHAVAAAHPPCVLEIACYNGPTSHVVVGDAAAVDALEAALGEHGRAPGGLRHRRLDVRYGFHSRFTDPLIPPLEALAATLTLRPATIPVETCTAAASWPAPTARRIAAHTREPVFFGQAVRRLRDRLGPCTFVEAGSDAGVVSMARRALGHDRTNHYVPVDLGTDAALDHLADVTVRLWTAGHRVQFWPFHRRQAPDYEVLRLPPYPFEKTKHWLPYRPPARAEGAAAAAAAAHPADTAHEPHEPPPPPPPPPVLLRAKGVDRAQCPLFEVDPRSDEFAALVDGHVVRGHAQAPPALYVELATRALAAVVVAGAPAKTPAADTADSLLSVHNLAVPSPLPRDPDGAVELTLERLGGDAWTFRISSTASAAGSPAVTHATGIVARQTPDTPDRAALRSEFARYHRLTHDPPRLAAVRADALHGGTVLGGPAAVYRTASRLVRHAAVYRNVASVAATGDRVVGRVVAPRHLPRAVQDATRQALALDGFLQVAGLHANHMREPTTGADDDDDDGDDDDVFYRFASVERIQYGPDYGATTAWDVLGIVSPPDGGALVSDLFVYDAVSGQLAVFLLGVCFVRVGPVSAAHDSSAPHASRTSRGCDPLPRTRAPAAAPAIQTPPADPQAAIPTPSPADPQAAIPTPPPAVDPQAAIWADVCGVLETIAEVPRSDVRGHASFEDLGVDSLMMIEVVAEIARLYSTDLPVDELEALTDVDALVRYLHGRGCRGAGRGGRRGGSGERAASSSSSTTVDSSDASGRRASIDTPATGTIDGPTTGLPAAQQVFDSMRFDFDQYADQTAFSHFWARVYPDQAALVDAYILDAFRTLGSDLAPLAPGQPVPPPAGVLPRHARLLAQLYQILAASGLLQTRDAATTTTAAAAAPVRTARAIDPTPAPVLLARMLQKHPQHAAETSLLDVTGSRLAACLTGQVDPRQLLFADRAHRAIMADVYAQAPMCQATTRLLAAYLARTFSASSCDDDDDRRVFRIIEVGAGTGGTACYLVDALARHGVRFEYTFTDISSSLVGQAQKTPTLAGRDNLRFATLDIDRPPPPALRGQFDVVVATNCLHATPDTARAAAHVASLLRPGSSDGGGVFCLVEFTRGLYWFDLVYGLLDGWWAFQDGRPHALADQWFWDQSLRTAGFQHVAWTDGPSEEARTMRLLCAFPAAPERDAFTPRPRGVGQRAGLPVETFRWKQAGPLDLLADVYYPKTPDAPGRRPRPVALMIHGGGHLLFSRRDIPMKHVRVLLQRGYLPVSVDYRLCPEMRLWDGPVTDCRDALRWVRQVLPSLPLAWPHVRVDPARVLALGWSSGGQLAMTLGYTAAAAGVKPPDVILPFYAPSDLEADFWDRPIFPAAAEEPPQEIGGQLDCVRPEPILAYTPQSDKRATALSLTLRDDRARLVLHMNWKAQSVPVLIRGLPHKDRAAAAAEEYDGIDWAALPKPPVDQIRQCSPYWHIVQRHYRTPTFLVHGNADDWIPYQMTERTMAALRERGVPCGLRIPDQCGHAFDLFPQEDRLGVGWAAIEAAYDFAADQLQL